MTSNIAAEYIQRESTNIGEFNREVVYENIRKNVLETLRQSLRPEFLNRIDETIVFSSLVPDEIKQIVELQLGHLRGLLEEKDVTLGVTDVAITHIAEASFDQTYGARPIKRYINRELSQRVAKMMLAGELQPGECLTVDAADGTLTLSSERSQEGEEVTA